MTDELKVGARNSEKDKSELRAAKQKANEVSTHLTNAGITDDEEGEEKTVKEGAVKILDNGKIGGYLVVFSDANSPDLTGDFFTKSTYFGEFNQVNILYEHGFDAVIQKKSLGIGEIKIDDVGVWVETQLKISDEYDKAIADLVASGKLKWSSGTGSHLVERVPMNGSNWIKSWPLYEASLTPRPAEPRTQAVVIKSVSDSKQEENELMSEHENKSEPKTETANDNALENNVKQLNEKFEKIMAFLDTPQGQSLGYVTPDGGTKDEELKSFGDFAAAVWRSDVKRLENIYSIKLNEGDGASGGYTVPPQYISQLTRATVENSIVRPKADVRQLSGREAYFPMLDYSGDFSSGSSTALAGMSMAWVDEAEEIDDTDINFRQMHVITRKMARTIPISNELMRDSVMAIETTLTSMFGEAIAYSEDYHFLRGSGVGQPLGIYNSNCIIETDTAFSDPVTVAEILTMYKRLSEESKRRAVWIVHPMLQDNVFAINSTNSGTQPLVQDISQPAMYRLLGLPILFSEKVPELTDQGGVLLADFSQYLIADSGSISLAMSDHKYFSSDQVAIRVTKRVDGQPKWNSTRAIGHGTNSTVSPFVKSK
jgi:HK97 family phage major capsid protein